MFTKQNKTTFTTLSLTEQQKWCNVTFTSVSTTTVSPIWSNYMTLSAENIALHFQACFSLFFTSFCSCLSFPVSGSQVQTSIVPHCLYMELQLLPDSEKRARPIKSVFTRTILQCDWMLHRWIKHCPWLSPGKADIIS